MFLRAAQNIVRHFFIAIPYNEPMSTRRAKQLIYGALYAIFWIAVIAVIYFVFTWVSGNTIAAPQCGAECVPTSTQPIAVQGNIATFVTSPGHDTFLAQVANLNGD